MLATGDTGVRYLGVGNSSAPKFTAGHVAPAEHGVPRLDLTEIPAVKIADDLSELVAAFRLVYRRYAERGLVSARPNGLIYSPEFARGESRTLVAVDAQGDVSATATFLAEPDDPDADAVIPWRLIQSYDPTRRLAGVTCLASLGHTGGPSPMAFFALARFLFQYAKHRGYDGLAITIHPRQLRFYKRICPIVPLSPVYRQEKLGDALAVACRIDIDRSSLGNVHPAVLTWFESPLSDEQLNRPGISDLDDLFLTGFASGNKFAGSAPSENRAVA